MQLTEERNYEDPNRFRDLAGKLQLLENGTKRSRGQSVAKRLMRKN